MWSETVSVINLQTLKSILTVKVHKMRHFYFKNSKKFLCPLNSPPLDNTSGSATAADSEFRIMICIHDGGFFFHFFNM